MIYYSSQHGLTSDANLSMNASTVGVTNNQTAVQAFADLADGVTPTVLVIEGAYMIDQIRLKSNTTLRMLNSNCGLIQSSSYLRPMIVNYNMTAGAIQDTNIKIEGGILNGNGTKADGTPVKGYHSNQGILTIVSFSGVSNVTISGTKFRNSRTFMCYVKNATNVWYYDCEFRQNGVYAYNAADPIDYLGHDGTKFGWGVSNSGGARLHYIDINDDWVSFCANDGFRPDIGIDDIIGGVYAYDPYAGCGDITNMRFSDITLTDCYHGVRIMTHSHSVDNIIVERVTGNVIDFLACIDRYSEPEVYSPNGFHAKNGDITFDRWNVTINGNVPHYEYKGCGLNIDVPVEQFNFTNSIITNLQTGRKVIRMDTGANVKSLFINNFAITGVTDAKTLISDNGGSAARVGNLYQDEVATVLAGQSHIFIATNDVPIASLNISAANTRIIYKVGSVNKSHVPDRVSNGIIDLEKGKSYYIIAKEDIDLENHRYHPLTT